MTNRLRALFVEDSKEDSELIAHELRRSGFELTYERVDNATAMNAALDQQVWDVIIADYSLPQFSGLAALTLAKGKRSDVPFIIVSGSIGEETAVSAMRAGAQDYLMKHNLSRLAPAIERELREAEEGRQRKRMEEELHAQSLLIDLGHDAVIIRDMEGCVTTWNQRAERTFGWTAGETIGRNISDLLYRGSDAVESAGKALAEKGEWHGELHPTVKSGQKIVVDSRWMLMRDAQGNPKAVLEFCTDVTERKKLEAQLLRAQRMESVGTLASGIAHDLNNILAPILMSAGLLRENITRAESERIVSLVESSARRGAEIVKQLLTFGRGVEGERIVIQPRHLVKEIAKIIRETFPKTITLSTKIASDLWPLIGDATQLHQVLLNLCVNSRDAMPKGGNLAVAAENIRLDENFIAMNAEAKVGPYVVLRVTDTGHGIPLEILERVFDPFFTTKELGKGTGLGLSTVLGIVRSHGGFVNVYSEAGKGAVFKIYLPAIPDADVDAVTATAAAMPNGKGELIVVVDDEVNIREATQRTLERHGYRTLVAADGTEAVGLFAQHSDDVQVVVTDMMMPFMDGVAVIRALKKMAPQLKIIACSGLGSAYGQTRISELNALGVSTVLAKPYTADRLLKVLQETLNG